MWKKKECQTFRTMDDSYHGLFVPFSDFSYRWENFSFFTSKVAIKVVGLRREHTARLLKRTMPQTTTTTNPPPPTTTTPTTSRCHTNIYNNIYVAVSICGRFWLSYIIFDAVFVCRRIQNSYDGTKSPRMVRKVWFPKETHVYGIESESPIRATIVTISQSTSGTYMLKS